MYVDANIVLTSIMPHNTNKDEEQQTTNAMANAIRKSYLATISINKYREAWLNEGIRR